MNLISIDPGEKHCGVAVVQNRVITSTHDYSPAALFDYLNAECAKESLHVIVCEEFRLYPWKAQQPGFSTLETVEIIGTIKWLCKQHQTELQMQPATIKNPTFAIMNKRNIALQGKNQHERDAEAHAYHYIERH